ncbi:MAG: N-acetylneuraminate synthase family protein, partial [Parcubacteria group bacterium]|nr:N-acetylneuraminate synthase family protein [Parcubacteria group bacterium]
MTKNGPNGILLLSVFFFLAIKIKLNIAPIKYAKKIGITIFSSPLSERNVDFLESMKVPAYKI